MFNLLVSGSATAWESEQRMKMMAERFGEYSGDECAGISLQDSDSLERLEPSQTILMYEVVVDEPHGETVRVGQLRDIRVQSGYVTFRFTETGRVARSKVIALSHRLQMDSWELSRTHWAMKDGTIPQELLVAVTADGRQSLLPDDDN